MSVTALIVDWLTYRERMAALGRVAPSTLANQRQIAATLTAALRSIDLAELRKSHVDLYAAERLQTCRPVTINAELGILRQILNWAVDEQRIVARPRFPTVSVPNVERALPCDDDYLWFLRTMSTHHGDPLEFMLLTGLAPHELERLHVGDLDRAASEIVIGGREDFRVKQESRRRRVPLNDRALSLWEWRTTGLAPDAAPFPRATAMQKAMRRHFLESIEAPAAADGLTPKMMRKWFASKISEEHSEAVLQRLLGHAPGSPVTRRHYVRSNADQLERAVDSVWL